METLKDRIKRFIIEQGVTVQSFEGRCGLSNGAVAKMGDNTRRSTLTRIKSVYPNLNIDWLLTGVGEMLAPTAGESDIDEMFDADIQANNNVIAQNHHTGDLTINAADSAAVVRNENEMLKEKVGLLERMLKEKDEMIGLLKEMMGRKNED